MPRVRHLDILKDNERVGGFNQLPPHLPSPPKKIIIIGFLVRGVYKIKDINWGMPMMMMVLVVERIESILSETFITANHYRPPNPPSQ